VLQMLRNSQCVSIVGPRLIGKTSLLLHLHNSIVQREYGLTKEYTSIYADCRGLGDVDETQLCQWLWSMVKRTLVEQEMAEVGAMVSVQAVDVALGTSVSEGKSDANVHQSDIYSHYETGLYQLRNRVKQDHPRYSEFLVYQQRLIENIERSRLYGDIESCRAERSEVIGRLNKVSLSVLNMPFIEICRLSMSERLWAMHVPCLDRLREAMVAIQEKGGRLMLLLDEFESIVQNPHLDQDFFSHLHDLVPTLVYITATHRSLEDLLGTKKSALKSSFLHLFAETHLDSLKAEEGREMVCGLLKMTEHESLFTEKDMAFVFELGGYHPFLLQLACYHLFDQKSKCKESAADYEKVRLDYIRDVGMYFDYVWESPRVSEQEFVRRQVAEARIAKAPEEAVVEGIPAEVNEDKASPICQTILAELREIRSVIERMPILVQNSLETSKGSR